jgi:hypothetical protein
MAVIHNAGAREVAIVDLRFPASNDGSQESGREVTIPAGSDDRARVRGLLDCAAGLPTELEAAVRTEAGLSTVILSVPPGSSISFPFQAACPPAEGAGEYGTGVYLGWTYAPGQAPQGNRMELSVDHELRSERITGVELAAAGFAAEPVNLPVELEPTMTTVLELDWTVTDCAATHELGSVLAELTLTDGSTVRAELPYEAVAHLASIAVAECGS